MFKCNVKEQLVVRKDTDVNEHNILSNITLRLKSREQLLVRKDMAVLAWYQHVNKK
jgi:hypothetical protein